MFRHRLQNWLELLHRKRLAMKMTMKGGWSKSHYWEKIPEKKSCLVMVTYIVWHLKSYLADFLWTFRKRETTNSGKNWKKPAVANKLCLVCTSSLNMNSWVDHEYSMSVRTTCYQLTLHATKNYRHVQQILSYSLLGHILIYQTHLSQ